MSNLTIIANELSDSESLTESCQTPPSLAISEHSLIQDVQNYIEALRMLSQADSLASHLVMQENDSEQKTQETCGRLPLTASASYDPDTHSWKTYQGWLLLDILEPSFQTFTKAGMTVDGGYYPQPNWERRINEIGFGLWPTPQAFDAQRIKSNMGMETEAYQRRKSKGGCWNLSEWIAMGKIPSLGTDLVPAIAEAMMGWPLTWTDLKPLETDRFQQWLQRHGEFFQEI